MERDEVMRILEDVAQGSISPDDAVAKLNVEMFSDLGFAKVDHTRTKRTGVGEVIYGAGKTPEQIVAICQSMIDADQQLILITRLSPEAAEIVGSHFDVDYHDECGIGIIGSIPEPTGAGSIVVACAGTSDLSVAEEAALTAECLGNRVIRLYDVGVAGIHRLLSHADDFATAHAVVAVAGMEGALASVIGGMASCPVIAVPTSVGYGASFGGVAALLAMLNSCASGVSVVNIDNGFGAGYQASLINHPGNHSAE